MREETKMRLYIAGPMTWKPQFNFPAFMSAAESLRKAGYEVVSPAELDDPEIRERSLASPDGDPDSLPEQTWGDALARDVKIIADGVDGTVLLGGWEKSRGARLEAFITRLLGKPVFYNTVWSVDTAEDASDLGRSHHKVCHCQTLGVGDETLVELDDTELDAVLMEGDLSALLKIERDRRQAVDQHITVNEIRQTFELPTVVSPEVPEDTITLIGGGEVRITSETGGQKGRKPERLDLIPPEPLWELARVYGMGAEKYEDHNYLKGYDWSLSYGALLRHVTQWGNGEDTDDESGLSHLAHAAWHCFALMMFQQHALGTDDRLPTAVPALQEEAQ